MVDDLIIENSHVVGVNVSDLSGSSHFNSEKLGFDAVVLVVGHSVRSVSYTLLSNNVELVPKDFVIFVMNMLVCGLSIHKNQ
nr:FAD/NAD(P)-binding oxidoreductase family protein [Tanacetum cinerariifolium]